MDAQIPVPNSGKWPAGPNLENPIPILVGIHEVNFLTMRRQRHTGWQVPGTGTEYGWWWLLVVVVARASERARPVPFRMQV